MLACVVQGLVMAGGHGDHGSAAIVRVWGEGKLLPAALLACAVPDSVGFPRSFLWRLTDLLVTVEFAIRLSWAVC